MRKMAIVGADRPGCRASRGCDEPEVRELPVDNALPVLVKAAPIALPLLA